MLSKPMQRRREPIALITPTLQMLDHYHPPSRLSTRVQRLFHKRSGLALSQLTDNHQKPTQSSNKKLEPYHVQLPVVSNRVKRSYRTARRQSINDSRVDDIEVNNRLLSPKILKFRAESMGKRDRVFSAGAKVKDNGNPPGWLFTFGREEML